MHIIKSTLWAFFLFLGFGASAQNAPFSLQLEPLSISNLGGVQSYAVGQHNGVWLIVGGRLDGLHRRQPWAAFDQAGHNTQIWAVDPQAGQRWVAPLSSLPVPIQEHLSATNPQFYQQNDTLFVLGGYGYSATAGDHITHDKLTAMAVPQVINALKNNSSFTSYFQQITDPQFQVTGGRLKKMGNRFYLLGGQKFMGRYNPMGPNHGPGFVQEYTNAVRIFSLSNAGTNLSVVHHPGFSDTIELHRRDYNAEAQILPNGEEAITMFSGVFQPQVDLPFLNAVTVQASGYNPEPNFQQYYNHYHCAVLPLFSATDSAMHTVFFGGIAQYYDQNGTLIKDDNVPFVNTIARVTRNSAGAMAEYKMPVTMPALLGAGSEFIANESLPHYANGVLKLDSLPADTVLAGYIFGGISSSAPNIFFTNNGTQSSATAQIFKVLLTTNTSLDLDALNPASVQGLNLRVFPNPHESALQVKYFLAQTSTVKISITAAHGALVYEETREYQPAGERLWQKELTELQPGQPYLLTIEAGGLRQSQKIFRK